MQHNEKEGSTLTTLKLTAKQQRFCEEYVIDSNATQAAIRAGYSEKTAQPASSRLLSNVMVAKRIRELTQKQSERADMAASEVRQEAERLIRSDVTSLFNLDGSIKQPHEWPEEMRRVVSSVEMGVETNAKGEVVTYVKKVRLWDKPSSLEKLFKHHGLYEQDNKQKNPLGDRVRELSPESLERLAERLTSISPDRKAIH